MTQGILINFEGIDGAGKGDQLSLIFDKLVKSGIPTIKTREPGGYGVAEEIRLMVKEKRVHKLLPMTELLLFFAARNENYHRNIKPHLEQGFCVLTDRWTPSSRAYQCGGRGMDKSVVSAVDEIVLNSVVPDLTILLDVDLETSNSRKGQREYSDTFDEEVADFHQRVRQDYLAQAKERPDKFFVVDGRGGVEEIHQKVFNKVVSLLNRHAELQ